MDSGSFAPPEQFTIITNGLYAIIESNEEIIYIKNKNKIIQKSAIFVVEKKTNNRFFLSNCRDNHWIILLIKYIQGMQSWYKLLKNGNCDQVLFSTYIFIRDIKNSSTVYLHTYLSTTLWPFSSNWMQFILMVLKLSCEIILTYSQKINK